MAGSRRHFQYLSDSGLTFAVEIDEGAGESASLDFDPIDTGANGPIINGRYLQASASRPLQMRYVNCTGVDANGDQVKRKFWVGKPTAGIFTGAVLSFPLDGVVWSVTSSRGETRSSIPLTDTNMTDGDVDDNFAAAP